MAEAGRLAARQTRRSLGPAGAFSRRPPVVCCANRAIISIPQMRARNSPEGPSDPPVGGMVAIESRLRKLIPTSGPLRCAHRKVNQRLDAIMVAFVARVAGSPSKDTVAAKKILCESHLCAI